MTKASFHDTWKGALLLPLTWVRRKGLRRRTRTHGEHIMHDWGRILIGLGLTLVVVGVLFVLGGRLGLGHLPGDFTLRRGHWTFAFPLATSIIASIVLTLVLNLLLRKK